MASDIMQTDERVYRTCIFYEAICKTPVEDAYKRMKTVKPNIDWFDFQYWYYRFLNGSVDFDHDRSKELKNRGLSDMPIEVAESIVGNLGLVDKLSTRRVCRKLRAVIDNQPSKFQNVSMRITEESCEIQFEQLNIEYSAQENGNCLLKTPQKTISLKGDYSKMAMEEFAALITHPNWSFEQMDIDFTYTEKQIKNFISIISDHQIHVKQLRIAAKSLGPVIDLIPRFDENILESIDFNFSRIRMDEQESSEKLLKMNQWKNAKKLKLSEFPFWLPIESLFHCKEFAIEKIDMSDNDFRKIGDILFKTPTFESCRLVIENDYREYTEELFFDVVDDYFGARTRRYDHHHYPIENSNDYFKCTYSEKYRRYENYPPVILEIQRVRV
ncbi:unnamed protein product [Caenorhabditis brenneri]